MRVSDTSEKEDKQLRRKDNGVDYWRRRDERIVAVCRQLDKECSEIIPMERRKAQCSFNYSLAQIVFHRTNPEALLRDGAVYRWAMYKVLSATPIDYEVLLRDHVMAEGCTLLLQIKSRGIRGGVKWWDWLCLQNNADDGKVGLYTCRDFPKGAIIGAYAGPTGNKPDGRSIRIAGNEGVIETVCPSLDLNKELYLGFQFARSKNEHNSEMLRNGVIKTTKRIPAGNELLLSFPDWSERANGGSADP